MRKLRKVIGGILAGFMILCAVSESQVLTAEAVTVYESDGVYHREGYIIVGESHAIKTSMAIGSVAAASGNVFQWGGANDIAYEFRWDTSIEELYNGAGNTFTMKGNLFFVYEGMTGTDSKAQSNYDYIYSDGKGKQGIAVQKIHAIINSNPNIEHWNIISMAGAAAASRGKGVADRCAKSYRNWIDYEFPDADIYILSVATMVKYYRSVEDRNVYNNTLAAAFPNEFLDYTDFYNERNPQRLVDTIHWDDESYVELVTDVLTKIEQKRGIEYNVTETEAVLYTNDTTAVYAEPSRVSNLILSSCEAGIPIRVTGVTDNGYFRIDLDGTVGFVVGSGLSEH